MGWVLGVPCLTLRAVTSGTPNRIRLDEVAELAKAPAAWRCCLSWLHLTRRLRGGISQQFRYLRDLPPASFEYSPQLTQRSRRRPAAYEMNHLRDYWTSLLLHARRPH